MGWSVSGNLKGPQGPQGTQGPQGIQGPQGAAGANGVSSTNYRGAWSNTTAYNQGDMVSENGASWIAPSAIAAGNEPNPSADGRTAANGWNVFAAEGAQGAQGVAGAAGATGATGPAGATGPQGPVGTQGAQGTQGTAGPAGSQGTQGVRGSNWYTGTGAPGTISGSQSGDQYLDTASGNVYTLS